LRLFPSSAFFTYLVGLSSSFFAANWEEYHTGVLRTSQFGLGLTECQMFLMLTLLVQGISGGKFSDLTIRNLGKILMPSVSQDHV
jgi:hypothetical protein